MPKDSSPIVPTKALTPAEDKKKEIDTNSEIDLVENVEELADEKLDESFAVKFKKGSLRDINKNKSQNLFRIVSLRYQKKMILNR